MSYIHQTGQSEWDETYTNFRVTKTDVEIAVIILEIFALVALIL
jgi:hypothetical protein